MGIVFSEYHAGQMKTDPEYREAYEALEEEFDRAQARIDARAEDGRTQKGRAEETGGSRSPLAGLEEDKSVDSATGRIPGH